MSNGSGLQHAPVLGALVALIGITASAVAAYMTNRAHIEDLQQRVTALELRLDRMAEHAAK